MYSPMVWAAAAASSVIMLWIIILVLVPVVLLKVMKTNITMVAVLMEFMFRDTAICLVIKEIICAVLVIREAQAARAGVVMLLNFQSALNLKMRLQNQVSGQWA